MWLVTSMAFKFSPQYLLEDFKTTYVNTTKPYKQTMYIC